MHNASDQKLGPRKAWELATPPFYCPHLQGKDVASVKALLVFGADINYLNGSGQTPLDIALQDDNMEMVEYLASFGAFTGEYMLQLQQARALEDLHLGKDRDVGMADTAMSVKLKGKGITHDASCDCHVTDCDIMTVMTCDYHVT